MQGLRKIALVLLLGATSSAFAASTGQPFYGDAPDATHPWCVHDWNRPQPKLVDPLPYDAEKAKPTPDAVVLFDGTDAAVDNWEADKPGNQPTKWIVKDGSLQCTPGSGYIRTKAAFGDCQLHIEWAAPTPPVGQSQGRGNSGIFLEGAVEIQVLDNYNNPTYADGFACSVYGVCPPLANALRPPGEYQSIDITFRRPVYEGKQLIHPGFVTVYCNGVLVQDKTQLEGGTGHMGRTRPGPLPEKGALKLQDHGNPVRYRNIWYRPLPARTDADDAGIHGPMSVEAAAATRKEIAALVRERAAKLPDQSFEQMLGLAELMVYERTDALYTDVEQRGMAFVESVKAVPADKIAGQKDRVRSAFFAFAYLAKFKLIDAADPALVELQAIVKAHAWDK
ncbi:MAG: DUF1080 domain-containing protein [Armatimonadetes bacterium]|nr:DUF1080 domain-containing protein [Armatimonadota bacterium]